MQCTETRWLTMKYVLVRIPQQWKNLKEYFMLFTQESNFKSTVANMDCYRRICAALQDPFTEAYISVCACSTTEFKHFLLQFQSNEPRIHLLSNLQQKCICKKLLSGMDSANLLFDVFSRKTEKLCSLLTWEQKQRAYSVNRHTSSKLLKTSWTNFKKIA